MPATSPGAQGFIAGRMREFAKGGMKSGTGRPGQRGATVTNPKQGAAIAYSEARSKGMKVPPAPDARSRVHGLLTRFQRRPK